MMWRVRVCKLGTHVVAPPNGGLPGARDTAALAGSRGVGRLARELGEVVDSIGNRALVGLRPAVALDGAGLTGSFVLTDAGRDLGVGGGGGRSGAMNSRVATTSGVAVWTVLGQLLPAH